MDEQTAQLPNRYRDFDAAFAEAKDEPVIIRLFGEEEQLPAFLPAGVPLEIMRIQQAKGKDNMQDEDILYVAVKLFGTDRISRWVDKGLDIRQLAELTSWTLQQYGVAPEAKAGAGGSRKQGKK